MTQSSDQQELSFTDRQRSIAHGLVRRTPIKKIADDLNIAPSTVNDHIKAIKRKVGVETTSDLVAYFVETEAGAQGHPPNEGEIKERVTDEWIFENQHSRELPEAYLLKDSIAARVSAPWNFPPEPKVVPEELDGPDALQSRLLAIGKIVGLILAAVVLTITAFQAVDGLVSEAEAASEE